MTGAPIGKGNPLTMEVTGAQLADLFGVSPASIVVYARDHAMPRNDKSRYPLKACVRWIIQYVRDKATGDSSDIAEERRRLIIEQRKHQELENARLRGELLDAEAVASEVHAMMASIATQLDGLGPRLAGKLSTLDDPSVIERLLFDECRNIRKVAAGHVAAQADHVGGGENTDAPAKPRRRAVGRRAPDTATGESRAGAVAD